MTELVLALFLVMMFPVMKLLENYLIKDAHKNILKGVSINHILIQRERERESTHAIHVL